MTREVQKLYRKANTKGTYLFAPNVKQAGRNTSFTTQKEKSSGSRNLSMG